MIKVKNSVLFLLFVAMSVTSCNGTDTPTSFSSEAVSSIIESSEEWKDSNPLYFENGVHDFTAPEANTYMVRNGVCEYKVVVPHEVDSIERKARDEFIYFFQKATGITLPVLDDMNTEETLSVKGKYIFIGNTYLTPSYVDLDINELGADGVRILTKQNSVFLCGASSYGTLNAVYDFMAIMFNYEQYSVNVYDLDTDVTDLKFRKFDVKDIPDIPTRTKNYGFLTSNGLDYDESMFGYRMRVTKSRGEYFMPIFEEFDYKSSQRTSTNCDWYLPYGTYSQDHPLWFSDNCSQGDGQYQFCYTAHGDEQELQLMIEEVAKKMIFSLQHFTPDVYPDMNVITCTMQDNFRTCTCNACKESAAKYGGADSAAVVKFMNRAGEIVKQWQNDPKNYAAKRDNLRIIYFAYNAFEQSPTFFNQETGCYEPIDDSVILNDITGIYFAEINQMDYQRSMFDQVNAWGKSLLDGWCVLTDFVYYWTYETNFAYYLYPYDSFSFNDQRMYNYIASKDVEMYFAQGQETSGKTGIGWNNLKAYLDAKLTWDSTLNQQELMDNYFKAMYGAASDKMWEAFNTFRLHYQTLVATKPDIGKLRSNYCKINVREYWPLATLDNLVNLIDEAKEILKAEESDNPMLNILLGNCEAQAVSPLFIILDLYANTISNARKHEVGNRLLDDVATLGLENQLSKESGGSTLPGLVNGYLK